METVSPVRHGLILGKFLPPHAGHLHLIETALKEVDRLTVLVCSLESEPIPGIVRAQWLSELAPDARVLHVTDENPSYPEDHPDFWELWVSTIRRVVPEPIDVVFTSESYGEDLARRLGARHRMVDPSRGAFPVSGSAIRSNPDANWNFIPKIVRPWFVRRVVLTGSECTGKTTLAARLAEHYETIVAPEFGREYVDSLGRWPEYRDVEAIARGQIASEDRAALDANRILILDTDLLSTIVYSRHYYGEVPDWLDGALAQRRPWRYLLAGLDVPWVADGLQRDRGHMREEMQALFRNALVDRGLVWTDIHGSVEERLAQAVSAIGM